MRASSVLAADAARPGRPPAAPGGQQGEQGQHGGQAEQRDRPGAGGHQGRDPAVQPGRGGGGGVVRDDPDDRAVVAVGGAAGQRRPHVLEGDQAEAAGRAGGGQAAVEPVVEDQQRGRVGPPGRRPQPDDHDRAGRPFHRLEPAEHIGQGGRVGNGQDEQPVGSHRDRAVAGPERAGRAGGPARAQGEQPGHLLPLVGEHLRRREAAQPGPRVVGPDPLDRGRAGQAGGARVVLQGGQGVDPAAGGQRQHPGRQRLVDGQGGHEPGHLRPVGPGRLQRLVHGEPLHQHQHPRRRHRLRPSPILRRPRRAGARQDDHDAHHQGQEPTHPGIVAAQVVVGSAPDGPRRPWATRSDLLTRWSRVGAGRLPWGTWMWRGDRWLTPSNMLVRCWLGPGGSWCSPGPGCRPTRGFRTSGRRGGCGAGMTRGSWGSGGM